MVFIRPVPGDTLLVDGRPAVVVSLLPCRRRYEATARYAYDLPCSQCGAPLGATAAVTLLAVLVPVVARGGGFQERPEASVRPPGYGQNRKPMPRSTLWCRTLAFRTSSLPVSTAFQGSSAAVVPYRR